MYNCLEILCDSQLRHAFGFHNPNHAAALACALLPLLYGWRRSAWVAHIIAIALFAAILLTRSRTGVAVAALEWMAWLCLRPRRRAAVCAGPAPQRSPLWVRTLAVAAVVAVAAWWMWPRIALDGSILNRPMIWLAGLRLFAANPSGVGLGSSGALASAYLIAPEVPEVRTLISSHLTLLAEFGWIAGWAWLAFIIAAWGGVRRSPRIGVAFMGLVVSASLSTVFDWPALLGSAGDVGAGCVNRVLSWLTLAAFAAFGVRLLSLAADMRRFRLAAAVAAVLVLSASLVPHSAAPRVRGGYAVSGREPRTLALHDGSWGLRAVRSRAGANSVVSVMPVLRFPREADLRSVDRVLLFGLCREWAYLVKGAPAVCVED